VSKNKLLSSLKTSKARFGGYATLLIVGVLAVIVVINVLVDQIPGKIDLTQNKIYSLSQETYTILDALKTDVTITAIGAKGSEDFTVKTILGKYAARSRRVKLETVDPEMNPGWSKKYDPSGTGLSAGSLVVSAGAKYKTIGVYDMYNYDTQSYYSGQSSQPTLTSLSVEQRVTSALQYVTAEKNASLYVLEGHGEQTLSAIGMDSAVGNANYEVKNLNLLTAKAVPADATILLVLSPKKDVPADETEAIRAYLAGGGRAVILMDLQERDNAFPNLAGLLKSYGVEVRSMVVLEGDQSKMISPQYPYYIIPTLEYHDILSPLRTNNYQMMLPSAQAIQTLDLKKKTLKIESLLSSSDKSYGKRDIANIKTVTREKNDAAGPFALAVAITDPADETRKQDTQLVVVGDLQFLAPSIQGQVPGNGDFFMNSLGWLKGQKESLTIRAKNMQQMRLSINQLDALIFSGVVVILLPLLILGAGFIVWTRRRHL
jgi:ABC-2 type transport system permease protein